MTRLRVGREAGSSGRERTCLQRSGSAHSRLFRRAGARWRRRFRHRLCALESHRRPNQHCTCTQQAWRRRGLHSLWCDGKSGNAVDARQRSRFGRGVRGGHSNRRRTGERVTRAIRRTLSILNAAPGPARPARKPARCPAANRT